MSGRGKESSIVRGASSLLFSSLGRDIIVARRNSPLKRLSPRGFKGPSLVGQRKGRLLEIEGKESDRTMGADFSVVARILRAAAG